MKKNTEENAIDKVASVGTNQASSEIRSRDLTPTSHNKNLVFRNFSDTNA